MSEVPVSITKSGALKVLGELEETVTALRRCFMNGSYAHGEKALSMENLGELLQYVAAYYSWAVTLWGTVKGASETAEQRRKLKEGNAFVSVKRGSKIAVKEAEAEASGMVESYVEDEMDWAIIFNRSNACKLALESFMRAIDSLKYIRSREWSSTE
jgi:hypothetical protein